MVGTGRWVVVDGGWVVGGWLVDSGMVGWLLMTMLVEGGW